MGLLQMDDSIYNDVSSFKKYESILKNFSDYERTPQNELCSDIISDSVKYSNYDVDNICPSVMIYLNKLQVNPDDSYKVKGCKYLYYALYEMAQNKNIPNEITYKLYNDLLKTYHSKKNYKFHVNIDNFNSNVFETLKNLLNLYDYFNKYERKEQCRNKTCDCAEECVKIYNRYIGKCNNHNSSSLCTELNKFAEKFNSHLNQDDFTPFRSKLNSPRTKTKMYNNFDKKLDHMQNPPKYVKGESINKSYNISYYSEDYT